MRIDKRPNGIITPPPSKSISHRALICAALSGAGTVSNIVENEDIERTLDLLQGLGAAFDYQRGSGSVSFSQAPTGPKEGIVLDCGESGSTLRFFIPIAALFGVPIRFTGKGRLLDRPIAPYVDALAQYDVILSREADCLSLTGKLRCGTYQLPGNVSSQFVTGLLFALPLLEGESVIEITTPLQSASYVDLTLEALKDFGIEIHNHDYQRFIVPGGQAYRQVNYRVEADYSSASFMLTAGVLGCDITLAGLNPHSAQGDRAFLDVIARCGGEVNWIGPDTVRVTGGSLNAVTVDVSDIPDLVPPMAVLMSFCKGKSKIINAARLRMKESDRIMSVATELNRLGGRVTEGRDFLEIEGVEAFTGGVCHSHNDHRIAMMVAVASLKSVGTVVIDNPDCVRKSYPGFWSDFLKV